MTGPREVVRAKWREPGTSFPAVVHWLTFRPLFESRGVVTVSPEVTTDCGLQLSGHDHQHLVRIETPVTCPGCLSSAAAPLLAEAAEVFRAERRAA